MGRVNCAAKDVELRGLEPQLLPAKIAVAVLGICADVLRGVTVPMPAEQSSQLGECLRSDEELLSGRSLDVAVERIGPEHAGEGYFPGVGSGERRGQFRR